MKTTAKKAKTMNVQTLPVTNPFTVVALTDIAVDETFNMRSTYEKIEELSEDIQRRGLLNPLLVCVQPGEQPYRLLAGFRRYKAMVLGGFRTADVHVVDVKRERDAAVYNTVENIREGITDYDFARSLARLKTEHRMTDEELAKELSTSRRISRSHVSNLIRVLKKAHPRLLEYWRDEHPAATLMTLLSLLTYDHEEQIRRFEEMLGQDGDGESEGDESEFVGADEIEPKAEKPKRPNEKKLIEAFEHTRQLMSKANGAEKEPFKVAVAVLKWSLARTKALKVGGVQVWPVPRMEEGE